MTLPLQFASLYHRRHDHTTAVCVSLPWSRGLHVVRLPAGKLRLTARRLLVTAGRPSCRKASSPAESPAARTDAWGWRVVGVPAADVLLPRGRLMTDQFSHLIYPLTARVVGAPQMISQPVSSIFPCSPLPSGTWRTPVLSIPWCCLPTASSVGLVFFPFHCALQDGFGQTWWTGDMTIPLQFSSLYHGQEVFIWSDCLLDLGTDFLVGNMVFV